MESTGKSNTTYFCLFCTKRDSIETKRALGEHVRIAAGVLDVLGLGCSRSADSISLLLLHRLEVVAGARLVLPRVGFLGWSLGLGLGGSLLGLLLLLFLRLLLFRLLRT